MYVCIYTHAHTHTHIYTYLSYMGTTYYYNHFSSIIKKGDKEFEEDPEEVDKKVKKE